MKKPFFPIATLFVAAAISVAVISCQKDKETENENQTLLKSSNDDAKELLNRIYAFQSLRDDINSGAKSGESMTLGELRDNIDLTFNFEHSQHATPFDYATLDTFYVRMPQTDANGNVSAADAIATYNAFETNLENLMANVDDDSDLAKNFSIKFPEAGAKSGDDIEVVFTRGTEGTSYPWYSPFEEGDDYIWGKNLGRCDHGLCDITDASNELTKLFQFKSESKICTPYKIVYVEYTAIDFYGGYNNYEDLVYYDGDHSQNIDYWLFLEFVKDWDDEPCIPFNELNDYYNSIYANVAYINAPLHYDPITNRPYIECYVKDNEDMITPKTGGQPSGIAKFHTLEVAYGLMVCEN